MQAIELLDRLLVNGPVPVADVKDAATANGMSWPTIERAKNKAKNIVAVQAGELRSPPWVHRQPVPEARQEDPLRRPGWLR